MLYWLRREITALAVSVVLAGVSSAAFSAPAEVKSPAAAGDDNTLVFSSIEDSLNSEISALVLTEAYRRLGISIEIRAMPAQRAQVESSRGHVDGELYRVAAFSDRYPSLYRVPTAVNMIEAVAFVHKPDVRIGSISDLAQYRLGIQRGIHFAQQLSRGLGPQITINNKQLLMMLYLDRIDAALIAKANGLKEIKQEKMNEIIMTDTLLDFPLHHFLHEKNQHLIPALDAVLKTMEKEGLIKQFRQQALKPYLPLVQKISR